MTNGSIVGAALDAVHPERGNVREPKLKKPKGEGQHEETQSSVENLE